MARDVRYSSKLGLLAGSSDVVHLRPSVSNHAAFTCVWVPLLMQYTCFGVHITSCA